MISDEQLLIHLKKKFDNFRAFKKKNYVNKHLENARLYAGYRDPKSYLWQTNVFLPFPFSMIQTILPRLVGYIWQGDKLVKAHPYGAEDAADADVVDNLMQWQTSTQIPNLFMEWVELLQTHCIQGNGIGKLTWDVYEDRPDFTNLDIFDFYPQPFKKYIDDMDCFHVYDMPVDILMQRMKLPGAGYKNIEKLMGTSMGTAEEEGSRERDAEVGKMKVFEPSRPTALVYEHWGAIPVQDSIQVGIPQLGYTSYKEGLVLIGNRNFVIRNLADGQGVPKNPYATPEDPNGFKPFISAKNYLDTGEFWGQGDIEPIKDLCYEMNESFSNTMDNWKLLVNRMWIVGRNAGVDLSNLMSYPGNVIQGGDDISESSIRPLENRELPQSSFKLMDMMPASMKDALGVHDYSKGANMPGMTDTVGGITSLIEEANMRFAFKIRLIQHTAIKDFATKLFKLDKIFMKGAEIPMRLQGQEGERWAFINPDNLKGMYDFKPIAVAMIGNKLARQNTQIRLLDVFGKMPPIPPLAESILEEFEIPNSEEIMTFLYQMWGMQPPGQEPPMMGGGAGAPLRQPLPPEAINNAQVGQQMGRLTAAGMR